MIKIFKVEGIPELPTRNNQIDKFSSYITLDNQDERMTICWKDQPYLKSNLNLYKKENKKFAELCQLNDKGRDLVQFWLDMALNDLQLTEDWEPANRRQLALEHLATYCEENCYWSARNVREECEERSWEEYFYIARFILYDKNKFLKVLKSYDSTLANVDTYLKGVLKNNIRSEADVGRFSRWRLLYKKKDTELREALQNSGRREPEISCFIFARKYFRQVYWVNRVQAPTRQPGEKWPEPETEDFEAAAQCYNAEKSLPSAPHEVYAGSATVTGKQIKGWMGLCIQSLQNYPKLKLIPLPFEREVQFDPPDNSLDMEFQGDSAAGEAEQGQRSLVKKIDAVFRQKLRSLNNIVEQKIGDEILLLDKNKILPLYYGFGLTQKQLEARVGVKQYTISRHMKKYQMQLLDSLAGLSQPNQWVKQYVEGWLVQDYSVPIHSNLIQSALVEAIRNLDSEKREFLQLRYGQKLDEQQIATALNINQAEVIEKLRQAKTQLQHSLIAEIDKWREEYVEKWLKRYYKSPFSSALMNALLELDPKIREVLQFRYGQKLDKQQMANVLNSDETEVTEMLLRARNRLRDKLLNWILENLALSLDTEAEQEKINVFLEGWLQSLKQSRSVR